MWDRGKILFFTNRRKKQDRILCCLLAMLISLGIWFLTAETIWGDTVNEQETYFVYQVIPSGSLALEPEVNEDAIRILGCREIPEDGVLKIPDMIDGKPVVSIGAEAFQYRSNLKELQLPESLRIIEYQAFLGCGIRELVLPDSLDQIGIRSFSECNSLSTVTIPKNFASSGSIPLAFFDCGALEKYVTKENEEVYCSVEGVLYSIERKDLVAYPSGKRDSTYSILSGVETIGQYAFQNSKLKQIDLPDSLRSITADAFALCNELTRIDIPASVEIIPMDCFNECHELETVILHEGLTTIQSGAFSGCSKLKNIDIPGTVTEIGQLTFVNDYSLTRVEIPEGVRELKENLFGSCSSLAYVRLPDSLNIIGPLAFLGHGTDSNAILTIYIPENVTAIDDSAFENCNPALTIYSINSVAEAYAKTHNIGFVKATREEYEEQSGSQSPPVIVDPGPEDSDNIETDKPQNPGQAFAGTIPKKQKISGHAKYTRCIGDKFRLDAKGKTNLIFVSSNKKVATVNKKGIVTMKGCGTCKIIITAESNGNYLKATKTVKVTGFLKKPSLKAIKKAGQKVKLKWSKVPGADGYLVYIKLQEESRYKRALRKSARVKGVLHKGLTKGKKYSYKVRAYKKNGKRITYSKYSKAISVRV